MTESLKKNPPLLSRKFSKNGVEKLKKKLCYVGFPHIGKIREGDLKKICIILPYLYTYPYVIEYFI